MGKVKKHVTLDRTLARWIEKGIENKRFASFAHALEYCVTKVIEIEAEEKKKKK